MKTDAKDFNERNELRSAWRQLVEVLPHAWLFDVPIECQQAVVELASMKMVGDNFFLIPFGNRFSQTYPSKPDMQRVDHALLELGNRLLNTEGESQRAHRSRILLAEKLLAVRGERPLTDRLVDLPLLRARRLPDDKDEAWSIAQLRRKVLQLRVFARPGTQGETDGSIDVPSDPKQATLDLADALGEQVWIVDEAVALTATSVD